jgi:hypothetical protein
VYIQFKKNNGVIISFHPYKIINPMSNIYLRPLIGLLFIIPFVSCQKDQLAQPVHSKVSEVSILKSSPVSRPYKDNFDTWYSFVPDVEGGWAPEFGPLKAWYPGGGNGTSTHIGKSHTYFNQYVPFNPPSISSTAAPVTQFFSTELGLAGFSGIPDNVSTITFDDFGNSIWFHQTSSTTTMESETRLNFIATADIVGGTGKFEGATGSTTINGWLNPVDQTDGGYKSEGTIIY